MTTFRYDTRYEVGAGESKGSALVASLTRGRLSPVIRLEFRDGRTLTEYLNGVRVDEDLVSIEGIGNVSGADIVAVALVNPEPPLDRSDELRGGLSS